MIEFELTWRPAMHVIGLEVRTSNVREADPATSVIGTVWQRFFGEGVVARIPHVIDTTVIYAVYTCYASDVESDYSFILGCSVDAQAIAPDGLIKAMLPPGSYVAGTSLGEPKDAVVNGWRSAGEYFAQPGAPRRSYTADLEVHRAESPREVELYLAVQ